MKKRKRILQDHKKVGSKLLPPFQYMLQPGFTDVSWIHRILPDVIWTAILNDSYGFAEGARLTAELTKTVASTVKDRNRNWCFSVTSFKRLVDEEKAQIRSVLQKQNDLGAIGSALFGFHSLYPESPFDFLTEDASRIASSSQELSRVKGIIEDLSNRTTVSATFAQANIVYGAFVIKRVKVVKGLALAEFPEIKYYPNTEKSKMIAASVRIAITIFFGHYDKENGESTWPKYFWNRGLELESCEFN